MGRGATKAAGNVYYEARMAAAKVNEKLNSREGAAEALGADGSLDIVRRLELDLYKHAPVDIVVRLADLYNAPHLENHYCLHECPLGRGKPISEEVLPIEHITVKLIKNLRTEQLDVIKDTLIDIAEDGEVTEDEFDDLDGVMEYLDSLSKTISELKIIGEMCRGKKCHGTD